MKTGITVLLVDDHSIVRQGIRALLEAQSDLVVVGESASGEQAIPLACELAPDVILMDLSMPGMGGIEAIRQLKKVSPHSQIVVLTSFQEDEYIFPTLRAGALSYVMKDIRARDLADTIRQASRGISILHPRIASRVIYEIQGRKRDTINVFNELSDRELEVLQHIAHGDNNATIAQKLHISEQTVKGHVSNILGKLHMADRTQAAVFAWQQGVVKRDSSPHRSASHTDYDGQ